MLIICKCLPLTRDEGKSSSGEMFLQLSRFAKACSQACKEAFANEKSKRTLEVHVPDYSGDLRFLGANFHWGLITVIVIAIIIVIGIVIVIVILKHPSVTPRVLTPLLGAVSAKAPSSSTDAASHLKLKEFLTLGPFKGIYRAIGVILGLHGDNGKENGNYYHSLFNTAAP